MLAHDDFPGLSRNGYNIGMWTSVFPQRRLVVASLLLVVLGAVSSAQAQDSAKRGRKYKAPPATVRLEVTVLRETNGKPVENASVIFHPLADGRDNGNMELKTNDDGKAIIDVLMMNSNVRLQVIAPGFQTYGQDYKVDKETMAIEVKLKRPSQQYSIYKKSEGAGAATDKSAEKPKDVPKDAPKDDVKPQDAPAPK